MLGQMADQSPQNLGHNELNDNFEKLRQITRELESELAELQQEQEQFMLQWQTWNKQNQFVDNLMKSRPGDMDQARFDKIKLDKQAFDIALRSQAAKLINLRDIWIAKYQENYSMIHALQERVISEELTDWKRFQQLAGNGGAAIQGDMNQKLEMIQKWCEILGGKHLDQSESVAEDVKHGHKHESAAAAQVSMSSEISGRHPYPVDSSH